MNIVKMSKQGCNNTSVCSICRNWLTEEFYLMDLTTRVCSNCMGDIVKYVHNRGASTKAIKSIKLTEYHCESLIAHNEVERCCSPINNHRYECITSLCKYDESHLVNVEWLRDKVGDKHIFWIQSVELITRVLNETEKVASKLK